MNLVLCGMMGAGKTTVGVEVARLTGWRCLDTDALIEERYGKISEIFKARGEAYFRGLETETVKELSKQDGLVISVGGGLVLKEENVDLLKQNGKIVFLRARVETLLKRLQNDETRPLLQSEEALSDRIKRLVDERTPIYGGVADFIVDVDGKTPKQIGEEIVSNL